VKGPVLRQRHTYAHISWLAAWSFLHWSKQDQIKIVFVSSLWLIMLLLLRSE